MNHLECDKEDMQVVLDDVCRNRGFNYVVNMKDALSIRLAIGWVKARLNIDVLLRIKSSWLTSAKCYALMHASNLNFISLCLSQPGLHFCKRFELLKARLLF